MKIKTILLWVSCISSYSSYAQNFSGEYVTEWQWGMNGKSNWVNFLRLDADFHLWKGGALKASTVHIAKTDHRIIDDWQTFSNIEEDNNIAAIAVFGCMYIGKNVHLFVGVRNVNEDFFTSEVTSLFTNSSCGIFPTISASYPIANYPLSGLTVYFDISSDKWVFKNSLYNGVGYNGWSGQDNPFLLRPQKDGIFDMAQCEYRYRYGHLFVGIAMHTRYFPVDQERMDPQVTTRMNCAWWGYWERTLWMTGRQKISLMLQYSENTCRQNACYRYGEIGGVYAIDGNQLGLSYQYARFFQGAEYSMEMTWRKVIDEKIAVQPTFQYIKNRKGNFTVLADRLHYRF